MHGVVIAAIVVAFVHFTGAVAVVAPVLGGIGTILTTADTVVADATGIRKYIAAQRAKHALRAVPIKPVVMPTKAPVKP